MQTFIEQQIRCRRKFFPRRERGTRLTGVRHVFNVAAVLSLAGFGIGPEEAFEGFEEVAFWTEMTEVQIARRSGFTDSGLHLLAPIAPKAMTIDEGRRDALTSKDVGEGASDG